MLNRWATFYREESGATAIEYALIAGFIGVAIAAVARQLGLDIVGLFSQLAGAFG